MRIGLILSCLVLFAPPVLAADNAELFKEKIAPIFERKCLSCHNNDKPKGELSLQTLAKTLAGGESGKAITPGNLDESLLLDYISGDEPEMPKDADPLSPAEVSFIRQWIKGGARWPQGLQLADKNIPDAQWWSFKEIKKPAVPELSAEEQRWARTPIDAFILAKLREKGLTPSAEADRRTLIRRLTYDLHGLPPTPEEIDSFVGDANPKAYEQLVDRLLKSPRYGERWARHWLDVVHYGDTHGYDKDKRRPNAWPYRDYVIRALNEDKPYSRFVMEQLAGDVLFPGDADSVVATGFVVAGPWDFVGHVELAEGSTDKKITRSLDRDDMVTNAMSTFSSLTVHCARCHNHKFDPISQEDYYSLQAVFAGIERADRPYDLDPKTTQQRMQLMAQQKSFQKLQTELHEKINRWKTPELIQLDKQSAAFQKELSALPKLEGKLKERTLGYHSSIMPSAEHLKWVQVDLGQSTPIDHVFIVGAHVKYGGHPGPGFGFPLRFKIEASNDVNFSKQKIVLADHTKADFANPGDTPYGVTVPPDVEARYVRVTAEKLWERTDDFIFALSEMTVLSGGQNVAAGCEVTALDSIEAGKSWGKKHLVDGVFGLTSFGELAALQKDSPTNGYHSLIMPEPDQTKWVQVDFGSSTELDRVVLVPARPTDFPDTPGFGFPPRFKVEASDDPTFKTAHMLLDHSKADFPNPGDLSVTITSDAFKDLKARYVRVTALKLWKRSNDYIFSLAELQCFSGAGNIARDVPVTALDSIETGRWSTKYLVDSNSSRTSLEDAGRIFGALARRMQLDMEIRQLEKQRHEQLQKLIDPETRQQLESIKNSLALAADKIKALPPRQSVYAATNAFKKQGNFTNSQKEPRTIHVLHRGSVKTPGAIALPGAISALEQLPARFELENPDDEGQRRAAFAHWIVDSKNPFTWRSIVNRVWLYHFGVGIVDSPNDFGRMGEQPSHPELLDYLAAEFRDGGQSLKALHKQIVLSAVYRQTSTDHPQNVKNDGGNRYLWRMNRRRLEAEAVRDAVLFVSGKLDFKMYGPGYDLFEFIDDHSPHYLYEKHNVDDAKTLRRTVYRFIVRSVPDPFMESLDCADPSLITPKRNTTLTALQALALMNNPLMVRQAEHFAARVNKTAPHLTQQIRLAYRLALGREPVEEELKVLIPYAEEHGMANVCRLILNTNEFIFVD